MVCFFSYDQTDLSDSKYNPLALQGISESEVRSDLQNYFFLLCYFVMKKEKFRAATSTINLCVNLGLAPRRRSAKDQDKYKTVYRLTKQGRKHRGGPTSYFFLF
jgi:hypothetical protein